MGSVAVLHHDLHSRVTGYSVKACQVLQAGQLLAHLLMAAGAGDRPVTLICYSMGARLAFHCLLELCRANAQARALHTRPYLPHDSVFELNREIYTHSLRSGLA